MPRYCSIFTCKYFTGCSDPSQTFFRYKNWVQYFYKSEFMICFQFRCRTQNFEKREKWINEIKKYQKIGSNFAICQHHFEKEHLRYDKRTSKMHLRPNAIPTIFNTKPIVQQTSVNLLH